MKIALITSVSGKTCNQLAASLNANGHLVKVFKPFKDGVTNFLEYDWVLSVGCSAETTHKRGRKLNKAQPVLDCVRKNKTFEAFNRVGVPTVRFWTDKNSIPDDVESLVVRPSVEGRKAEGLEYWDRVNGDPIPYAGLYTEYFYHRYEYRVYCVFGDVFLYYKSYDKDTGMHHFIYQKEDKRHKKLITDSKRAAVALGIDYVSFDVLSNSFEDYAFLEANSGSILTPEVEEHIINFFEGK